MKKIMSLFLLALLFISISAHAANQTQELLLKSNEAYRNRNFAQALSGYEQLSRQLQSADIYYNLANAAFKEKQLGKSILYYLKAKKLNPRDADIRKNLKYVQGLVEYRVEDKRNWYWQAFLKLLDRIRLSECVLVLLGVYLLLIIIFIFGLIFGGQSSARRLSSILIAILIASSIPTLIKFSQLKMRSEGVVIMSKLDVRYGPAKDEKLAFDLVEGIQLIVDDEIGDWYRISLVNGETGWALKNGIEKV